MFQGSIKFQVVLLFNWYTIVGRAEPVPLAEPLAEASIASITAGVLPKLGEAAAGALTKTITDSIKPGDNDKYKVVYIQPQHQYQYQYQYH